MISRCLLSSFERSKREKEGSDGLDGFPFDAKSPSPPSVSRSLWSYSPDQISVRSVERDSGHPLRSASQAGAPGARPQGELDSPPLPLILRAETQLDDLP